ITHFLTGACLARSGFNRKTALATVTMTLAAEAPDLDVLGNFKGPVFGFAHHRGFTHSFLGLFLVSAVVVGFMYVVWHLCGKKIKEPNLPPRWGLLYLFSLVAGLTHILLDFTNGYGVRPFWPFSERWYSWDIVFIIDPIIYVLLVAGLVVPTLFSLIDREIGGRRRGPAGRAAATLALVGVVAFWGLRDYEHRRVLNALKARVYEGANPVRASAYPYWWNPFRWFGVVETESFYALTVVDSLSPEVDPTGDMRIRYKPAETPVTLAAKRSYLGRVYLDWAKFPITETERTADGGYLVRFYDLRFEQAFASSGRRPLSAGVILDSNLNVVTEVMGRI